MEINGATRVFGLIGDPVDHSLSPFIMNRALAAAGIDAAYAAFPVRAEGVERAIAGFAAAGVRGINVTYPHKTAAAACMASLSDTAALLQAVNTVRFDEAGPFGENTDAPGTADALERVAGVSLSGVEAFVFGAGGAARAAAVGLLDRGAGRVTLAARTRGAADGFVTRGRERYGHDALELVTLAPADAGARRAAIESARVVINATPVGMAGHDGKLDGLDAIGSDHACFDFVYRPSGTDFLRTAAERGASALGGLALLVAQAARGFELWTGRAFDTRDMLEAAAAHMKRIEQE